MLKLTNSSIFFIVVIAAVLVSLTGCLGGASSQDPSTLKVMTYNIHHGAGTDGRLDLARIAEVITAADCDVIGLQEVDNNFGARSNFVDQAKWFAGKLDMHYAYAPAIDNHADKKKRQYGNAILSRYPIIQSNVHQLSTPAGSEPRVCLEAMIQIGGREYTFMVTHLDHRNNTVRVHQTADILKAVPHRLERTVLLGDFNCQPPDIVKNPQSAEPIARILEEFGDSFVLSKVPHQKTLEGKKRIDYIFVSPDLSQNITSYTVVRDDLTNVASDHFPLVVEINE